VLPVPRTAMPLPMPLRSMPLAILPRYSAQKGKGEENRNATDGNVTDHLAVVDAIDATRTTNRAYESFRVTSDKRTRASALACSITGVKNNVSS